MERHLGGGCVDVGRRGQPLGDGEFVENLEKRCGRKRSARETGGADRKATAPSLFAAQHFERALIQNAGARQPSGEIC